MKNKNNIVQHVRLTDDSHNRLIAYTTAAGLGAFFAGHSVEAQVVESATLAPYPHTLVPGDGTGPNGMYHYLNIDGGATPNFNLTATFPHPSGPGKPFVDKVDIAGLGAGNHALTPVPANPYLVSFLGGATINATNGAAPAYQPRLAIGYLVGPDSYGGYYSYFLNNYITTGALGFQFVGSGDGQTHFGYMDVQVNSTTNNFGEFIVKSVVIQDIYYNATANASITVPIKVNISSIHVGPGNSVTINFTSNDNALASAFTLLTSPALGVSANWTTDGAASITMITPANPGQGIDQASYQAVTTGTDGPAQFYRLSH